MKVNSTSNDNSEKLTAREAALDALLAQKKYGAYLAATLEAYSRSLDPKDLALAREISFGTMRMALALEHLIGQLPTKKRPLKANDTERAILSMALYQHYFMSKIPLHAIVNESVDLAKKRCNKHFASFINAILRKLEITALSLPEGQDIASLSVAYSYPPFFVEKLVDAYGIDKAIAILQAGNTPAPLMARRRGNLHPDPSTLRQIEGTSVVLSTEPGNRDLLLSSRDYYIQNVTPAFLMSELFDKELAPKSLLDLCASPGGKLLGAHDLYPDVALYANDVSEKKLDRIKENMRKYGFACNLHCGEGQKYPATKAFDLIILDVPCSNSGVLNKRPEARWRLSAETLKALRKTQRELLEHAASLLSKDGQIWFMTCSILKEENDLFIEEEAKRLGLKVNKKVLVIPNEEGWDGGFGCCLLNNRG